MAAKFPRSLVKPWIRLILKARYFIVLLAILLSVLGLQKASRLHLDSSLMALLPQNTPSIQRVDSLKNKLGGTGDLIIMLESDHPSQLIPFADTLRQKISMLEWARDVSYAQDDSVMKSKRLLYMDLADIQEIKSRLEHYVHQEIQSANPFLIDLEEEKTNEAELDFSDIQSKYKGDLEGDSYYRSPDHKILLLVIHPKGLTSNISFARQLERELKALLHSYDSLLKEQGIQASLGGTYINRIVEYDTILQDVMSSALLGSIVILALLLLYFRKILPVLTMVLTLLASLTWAFGLAAMVIGKLNLITAFLIIVLFGLGIDFGIHFLARYLNRRYRGGSHIQALYEAFAYSGRSSLLAAVTTAIAFFFLTFSTFLGFRDFGFIAGTGVLFSYIAFMILFPALLTLLNDWGWIKIKHQSKHSTLFKKGWNTRTNKRILVIGGVISVVCLLLLPGVSFEKDFRNLRSKSPSTRLFNAKMRQVFPLARDPSAVLVSDRHEAHTVQKYLKQYFLADTTSPIEKVRSLADIIPPQQKEKIELLKDIKNQLTDLQNRGHISEKQQDLVKDFLQSIPTDTMTKELVPATIRYWFLGEHDTLSQVVYLYQRYSLMNLDQAERFHHAVGSFKVNEKHYHAISEPIVYVDLVHQMEKDSVIAIIGILGILFLVVYWDVRKISKTFLVLLPVIAGLLWMLGALTMFGIKLNLFNLIVIPSILGLAVDAGIHIYHRSEEKQVFDFQTVTLQTGGAGLLSSLTTMGGFGSMLVAHHPGLQSLGQLAVVGLGASIVISVIFLPALIRWMQEGHSV